MTTHVKVLDYVTADISGRYDASTNTAKLVSIGGKGGPITIEVGMNVVLCSSTSVVVGTIEELIDEDGCISIKLDDGIKYVVYRLIYLGIC